MNDSLMVVEGEKIFRALESMVDLGKALKGLVESLERGSAQQPAPERARRYAARERRRRNEALRQMAAYSLRTGRRRMGVTE